MPIPHSEFVEKIRSMVRAHYERGQTAPLLLSHLGVQIEKEDAWPEDRNGRSLKQIIRESLAPDLDIVFDKQSPAYVAVVTPEIRESVEQFIAQRHGSNGVSSIRIEDIARPVLLAFCVAVHDGSPVYVRRVRPFRYEIGALAPDQAGDYVAVEPEYRRPDLRVDRPLSPGDRQDLESKIRKWAVVHGLRVEQFSKLDREEKEVPEVGKTALDRLIAAQPHDVASRLMIPADIAQILAKIH